MMYQKLGKKTNCREQEKEKQSKQYAKVGQAYVLTKRFRASFVECNILMFGQVFLWLSGRCSVGYQKFELAW